MRCKEKSLIPAKFNEREIAGLEMAGPITLVLDNARFQRSAVVQALGAELGLSLLFLHSYPSLNLIERL